MSDLKTFATFRHEGTIWLPEVADIEWCRNPDNPRAVQVKFCAMYQASRSRGARGAPVLELLQTSSCDALMTSFQRHLEIVAPAADVNTSFRIQLVDSFQSRTELQFRLKLRLEGETAKIMESFNKAWEVAPAAKMKDCPLM